MHQQFQNTKNLIDVSFKRLKHQNKDISLDSNNKIDNNLNEINKDTASSYYYN